MSKLNAHKDHYFRIIQDTSLKVIILHFSLTLMSSSKINLIKIVFLSVCIVRPFQQVVMWNSVWCQLSIVRLDLCLWWVHSMKHAAPIIIVVRLFYEVIFLRNVMIWYMTNSPLLLHHHKLHLQEVRSFDNMNMF